MQLSQGRMMQTRLHHFLRELSNISVNIYNKDRIKEINNTFHVIQIGATPKYKITVCKGVWVVYKKHVIIARSRDDQLSIGQ